MKKYTETTDQYIRRLVDKDTAEKILEVFHDDIAERDRYWKNKIKSVLLGLIDDIY